MALFVNLSHSSMYFLISVIYSYQPMERDRQNDRKIGLRQNGVISVIDSTTVSQPIEMYSIGLIVWSFNRNR